MTETGTWEVTRLTDWLPSMLLVAIWLLAWWRGTRRIRLWFALLAPFACVLALIAGVLGAGSQATGACSSSCAGGAVQRWAASFDSPSAAVAWLERSALAAIPVALALTVLTLIVEYILLVRREG